MRRFLFLFIFAKNSNSTYEQKKAPIFFGTIFENRISSFSHFFIFTIFFPSQVRCSTTATSTAALTAARRAARPSGGFFLLNSVSGGKVFGNFFLAFVGTYCGRKLQAKILFNSNGQNYWI
jgi:hypothetical protein